MKNVFLNIGSNIGNRRLNISKAVRAIEREFGYFELSHTVESKPEGFMSPNVFMNVGMMILTDLEPTELLRKIQEIEKEISPASHRDSDGNYIDRAIDIDIIAIDENVIESEELTVPHPRMHERRFVLEPMAEIASGWVHPKLGKRPFELLLELQRKKEESD